MSLSLGTKVGVVRAEDPATAVFLVNSSLSETLVYPGPAVFITGFLNTFAVTPLKKISVSPIG